MPPALEVDWRDVKTLALAIGVREAARRMGISEEAVMKRSSREKWLVPTQEQQQIEAVKEQVVQERRQRQGLSANVRTAAEILASMGDDTRSKLAIGVNKGAQTVAEMDGREILLSSQQVQQLTKAAATVHGWQSSGPSLSVRLDVIAQSGPEAPVIDI
jgi:hypothetical protein